MTKNEKEQKLWERIVADLSRENGVGEYGHNSCISKLSLREDTGTSLILEYDPNALVIVWVEINYLPHIIKSAKKILKSERTIEFVEINQEAPKKLEAPVAPAKPVVKAKARAPRRSKNDNHISGLNTEFTFDNFIVGPNNEFAHAAAQAVVQSKNRIYNPLYIHGGPGLGKTHLLQAIGNALMNNDDRIRVLYVTSEDFTNAYIDAMTKKGDSLSNFRKKYRNVDVLLIDDIQFMARKEKTQEEFFHTFNALFSTGKQIILSSDCPASEITTMDERLKSRFDQGMAVSITQPSLETRIAILRDKRTQWKSDMVSDEVLEFLAQNITCSVRHLEGALTRIAIFASFTKKQPSLEDARNQLQDLIRSENSKRVSIQDIQKQVAEALDVRISELNGRRRTAHVAHSRQIAMYLSRKCTDSSLQDIGEAFGGRDHGTVIHATRTIESKMEKDSKLRELITRMSSEIS